ncbi:hypothetical protein GGS24DRAFT_380450 [Hypoxylon argillaceum]|nr:hypothetical protein GGS24DRAFT_380450 [Hypoxylon argillaceum]KAI1148604.1 hypothetical protein F4825DRAFT_90480 [Nemania diffusa]
MSGLGPSGDDADAASMMSGSRGPALLAVSITTTVVALLTCILRYCVRSRINRMVGWEDYFVGGAMLLGIIGVSFAIVESVNQGDLQSALQFDYLAQPWLNMGSTLGKVSICLFVRRLVARVRVWRIALAVQIILLLLVNLAYTFTTLLQCRPLEKLWKPEIAGSCWSISIQQNIGYFQGAFDVFTQLFIALFPIMVIQDLGVTRNVRWPFYILSITSIIISMLGVLRTYNISLIQLDQSHMFEVITTILAVLEQNLNIISANILPISSLCSKNIRPISQAINEAASVREIDTTSMISKRSHGSRAEIRQSEGPMMMLEETQREDFDSASSLRKAPSADVWPQGIIKTVSVEVVEEDATNVAQDPDKGENRSVSRQQDWDSFLR